MTGHTNFVLGVAFSPDGRLLASCGGDRTVRLWDPAAAEHRRTLTGHGGRGPRTGVFLNVFAETALAPMYRAKLATVFDVAFSPDGRLLASCGDDRTVRLWDPATGEHRRTLTGHGRLGPRGGVQPGRAAAGQLRRRQHGAAVGPGQPPSTAAP